MILQHDTREGGGSSWYGCRFRTVDHTPETRRILPNCGSMSDSGRYRQWTADLWIVASRLALFGIYRMVTSV